MRGEASNGDTLAVSTAMRSDGLMSDQRVYWDQAATTKSFTHPLNGSWLDRWFSKSDRILDYGCGYGRIVDDLASRGFTNITGLDFSAAMIERGRRAHPRLDLRVCASLPTEEAAASFDAVLLFAVLTCIASDADQRQVINEASRLLRPGGVLYVSDMVLQSDARHSTRYAAGEERFGLSGVFETEEGAIFRHHKPEHFEALLADFDRLEAETVQITTMNGHPARALQLPVQRKPA